MLEIENLTKRFGGNIAVNSVSTSTEKGCVAEADLSTKACNEI